MHEVQHAMLRSLRHAPWPIPGIPVAFFVGRLSYNMFKREPAETGPSFLSAEMGPRIVSLLIALRQIARQRIYYEMLRRWALHPVSFPGSG